MWKRRHASDHNALYRPADHLRAECSDVYVRYPCMVLIINRLIFWDQVSARNWLGIIFRTVGMLMLLLQGNLLHPGGLKSFRSGDHLYTEPCWFRWSWAHCFVISRCRRRSLCSSLVWVRWTIPSCFNVGIFSLSVIKLRNSHSSSIRGYYFC